MGDRQGLGRYGEELATRLLQAQGYRLVVRGWRCRYGELDLVLLDRQTVVLVEVRARRGAGMGSPEESVGRRKRERLALLAQLYVSAAGWAGRWRIDVVAIALGGDGRLARVEHYQDAVEL